jgi:hypothetical protein
MTDCPCEKLWFKDPMVLLKNKLTVEDICESNNINAFTRALIAGLLLATVLSPLMGIGGLGLILLIIILLYSRWLFATVITSQRSVIKKSKKEGFQGANTGSCMKIITSPAATVVTRPSARNPFMNVLLDEITYNPNRPEADAIINPKNQIVLDDYFRVQWNNDPTDVFGRTQGQRQFYTMPSTSIPNDQGSYQNWLYLLPGKTCKEGGRNSCIPGTQGAAVPWLSSPN